MQQLKILGSKQLRASSVPAATTHQQRAFSSNTGEKIDSSPMVYISGEEMTHYASKLMVKEWIEPYIDTSKWVYFDLSCKARDETNDQVLHDAVAAGKDIAAIFKEPTITPTQVQVDEMGLSKTYPSPNGAMRRGWNGVSISRDTIHVDGMRLGFDRPVLFDRHAVGGEYHASWDTCGPGRLECKYYPSDWQEHGQAISVGSRSMKDEESVAVVYHNPLDNVHDMAHIFFNRCLEGKVIPYVVTKKTVFKWQEGFWRIMKEVFDEHYLEKFIEADLLPTGDLQHLISDAATMQIIRWNAGGFGMAAHNYDGDMLTDEISQMHRSPGFITSNLIGRRDDGREIKLFEASHGTVRDLWQMHLRGEETSLNPLGLAEALLGGLEHSAKLDCPNKHAQIKQFVDKLRKTMHECMVNRLGTRDLCGPEGLTTEQFIEAVRDRFKGVAIEDLQKRYNIGTFNEDFPALKKEDVDIPAIKAMFDQFDVDGDGRIDVAEFSDMIIKLNVAPKVKGAKVQKLKGIR